MPKDKKSKESKMSKLARFTAINVGTAGAAAAGGLIAGLAIDAILDRDKQKALKKLAKSKKKK